jgi:hypothetical protein
MPGRLVTPVVVSPRFRVVTALEVEPGKGSR